MTGKHLPFLSPNKYQNGYIQRYTRLKSCIGNNICSNQEANMSSLSIGDHHEHFAIDASGLVTVRNGALLDRESLAAVVLRVVATDSAPENHRRQSSVPVSKVDVPFIHGIFHE